MIKNQAKRSYCDPYLKREIDRWDSEGLKPFNNLELSATTSILYENDEYDEDNEKESTLVITGSSADLINLLRIIALGQQAKRVLDFGPMFHPYPET